MACALGLAALSLHAPLSAWINFCLLCLFLALALFPHLVHSALPQADTQWFLSLPLFAKS